MTKVGKFFGLRISLLCSCREYGHEKFKTSFKKTHLWQWLLFVVLIVCLHYHYNYNLPCNNVRRPPRTRVVRNLSGLALNNSRLLAEYKYHRRLMTYQRFLAMNYASTDLGKLERRKYSNDTPVCRMNYSSFGIRTVNKSPLSMRWVERRLPQVLAGGYHAPKHCRARHRVAILVPYRDRYVNLIIFLHYMHPLWQKQLLEYRVFVIEQYGNYKFNKGALYNIGFIESQRFGTWDCLVFHDVDLIPLDERVLYTCPRHPTHMSPAVESSNFTLQYETLFGGVTAMTSQQYLKVNGYSNFYWNWGAEDDDMYNRLQASKLLMRRLNVTIARFATLHHKPQDQNPDRYRKLVARSRFRTEGLQTVEYKVVHISKRKLFTHIVADVNPFKYKL